MYFPPSLVVARLNVSRSLPGTINQDNPLNAAGESLTSYPFPALCVKGADLRFRHISGAYYDSGFHSRVADFTFLLPISPNTPAAPFEECAVEITSNSSSSVDRKVSFDPPFHHPDGKRMYVHTHLRFLVRQVVNGGDPPPDLDHMGPYHLSSSSRDVITSILTEDRLAWNRAVHGFGRWSGGSDAVEPTWSTFSTTLRDIRGQELHGCIYEFVPPAQWSWKVLDSSPQSITEQLELFYQ